jgi:hypothetical protein
MQQMATRSSKRNKKLSLEESLKINKADIKSSNNKRKATKGDLLKYLTWSICQGLFRDAQTINEWLCTFWKICIYDHFYLVKNGQNCPSWGTHIGGKPLTSVIPDTTLQRIVDILYPEFKKKEDKIKRDLYIEQMKKLGRNVEEETKVKKQVDSNSNEANMGKQIDFILLPSINIADKEKALPNLASSKLKTGEKRDIKYIKRYLGFKLKENWEDIEIYWYEHKLNDHRDLKFIYKMHWLNHKLTSMKPEEDREILVLHYVRKGNYLAKENKD